MIIRDDRRDAAIALMADHVLSHGLEAATLRPLAAAAGTSDRMLLYYFADKDELLGAVLDRVAARMLAELDAAVPIEPPRTFALLLQQAWTAMASPGLRPFMPLWLDLAAGAARGRRPHGHIAGRIADGFLAWAEIRLAPDLDGAPSRLAPLFMAAIEGMYLLKAIGRDAMAQSAATELAGRSW